MAKNRNGEVFVVANYDPVSSKFISFKRCESEAKIAFLSVENFAN